MESSRSWSEWDDGGDRVDDDFDFEAAWSGDSDVAVAADGNINHGEAADPCAAFAEEVVDAFLQTQPGWNIGREVRPCYHPTKKQDDRHGADDAVDVSKARMTDTNSSERSEEEADADLFLSSHLSFMSSLGTPKRAAEEEQDCSNLFPPSPLFMDEARSLDTIPETSWSSSIEEKEIHESSTDDSTQIRDEPASALTDNSVILEPSEDLLVPNEIEPFEVRGSPATSKDSVMLELIHKPEADPANSSAEHYLETIKSKFGNGDEHDGVETEGEQSGSESLGRCLEAEQTSDEEDLSSDGKGKSISIYSFHNNLGIIGNMEQSGEEDLLFNEEKKQEDSAARENSVNSTDLGDAGSHTEEPSGAECPVPSVVKESNKQSLSPAVISQTSTDNTNRSETPRGGEEEEGDKPDKDCENSTDNIRTVTPRSVDHRTTNDIRFPIDEFADTFTEGAVYIFEDSHCRSSTASLTSQHSDLTAEFYQYSSNTRNVDMAELYVARERFRPVLHELLQRAAVAAEHRTDAHPSSNPWLMLFVVVVFFGLFRLSSMMAHCNNNSRQIPLVDDQCASDLFLEHRLRIIEYETGV